MTRMMGISNPEFGEIEPPFNGVPGLDRDGA
jgi:hypothetical protein